MDKLLILLPPGGLEYQETHMGGTLVLTSHVAWTLLKKLAEKLAEQAQANTETP